MWKQGLIAAAMLSAGMAHAQTVVSFKDPVGDDDGPGGYVYPTDAVYTKGSFDLTQFDVRKTGTDLTFDVKVNAPLVDHWSTGSGFSTQMIFVFIRTGAGKYIEGLPGLNLRFGRPGWDKVVILSPQQPNRVKNEVSLKAATYAGDVVIPQRTKGAGSTISASVPLASLGGGNPATWAYQVVIQSNEGFPDNRDLMTRKVNEYEGQHRFGGGVDEDCDPHVLDVLAGMGTGAASETARQHKMLAYKCAPDGSVASPTMLMLIRK